MSESAGKALDLPFYRAKIGGDISLARLSRDTGMNKATAPGSSSSPGRLVKASTLSVSRADRPSIWTARRPSAVFACALFPVTAFFVRAGLAAAWMKGKSYLSIGSVSMGIAGSIVDADFFQSYLGMRNEQVDMSELVRRFEEKIYSEAEFKRALEWVKSMSMMIRFIRY